MKRAFLITGLFLLLSENIIAQTTVDFTEEDTTFFFMGNSSFDSLDVMSIWGVRFQLGSYLLVDSNDVRILALASYMQQHPSFIFEVGYHRDCRGSAASSRDLSQRRAQSICERLIALGVQPNQVIPKGFGERVPISEGGIILTCDYIKTKPIREQEKLHAMNRRVEIRILNKCLSSED